MGCEILGGRKSCLQSVTYEPRWRGMVQDDDLEVGKERSNGRAVGCEVDVRCVCWMWWWVMPKVQSVSGCGVGDSGDVMRQC